MTSVSKNGTVEATYEYDDYGALAKETRGNVVTEYKYWNTGNLEMIKKTVNGVTTNTDLQYDDVWRDRLIAVGNKTVEYDEDAPGLPVKYYNGKKSYSFGWDEQGNLGNAIAGTKIVTYGYYSDGLRAFKTSGGVRHDYYYDGDRLIAETFGDKYFLFNYDENDSIFSVTYYDGSSSYTYQLVKNLQGDVIEIWNAFNGLCATYEYDAWGNVVAIKDGYGNDITNSTVYFANFNPIRYRSYYYDTETGFYYLKSRYYDPAIGRFISGDSVLAVDPKTYGLNLFAYCGNDPVNRVDPSGYLPQWIEDAKNWVNNRIIQPVKDVLFPTKRGGGVSLSDHDENRRPYTGEPNSTYIAPNGDTRTYGPDGTPEHDYDHNDHGFPDKHPHDSNGGHNHDWNNGVRGPAYDIWNPVAGSAVVTVCLIGAGIILVDDLIGIGIADDVLLIPIGTGLGEGFAMILG